MTKRFLIIFAAALLVTAVPAFAGPAPIVQTLTFGPNTPDMTKTLTFNKFNDYGGAYTLNSIQVLFNLTSSGGQLILDNDSAEPASGTFAFGARGNISSTDVGLLKTGLITPVVAQLNATYSSSFSLSGDPNPVLHDYNPDPNDGMLYIGVTEFDDDSGFIASILFPGYIGTGTYNIDASVIQWSTFGGVSGIEYAVTPVSANGEVTVIYNYTVPEPATISLLCIGTLALLKRKSSK
ncbi:MAG: choice-of-anchor E domain-containing protein [Sedimentisphaerales bacterium]